MHNYIEVIQTAIIYFPAIAFFFSIPFILHNYHKFGSISFIKSLIIYSFIFYLICAYFLVILPLPTIEYVSRLTTPRFQLIPLKFIYDFITHCGITLKDPITIIKSFYKPCFYVTIYNIFLTIPFAVYIRYYFKTDLKKTLLFTFLLSLFFEITQVTGLYFIYPRSYRLFDIDDLLLNTLGGLIGYYLSNFLLKHVPNTEQVNKIALNKGIKEVSGFRKATSILLDIFIINIIFCIVEIITKCEWKLLYLIIIIIYLFIIPIFFKGRTFPEIFLNLQIVKNNNEINLIRTTIRRLLFILFYIGLLYISSYIFIHYTENLSTKIRVLIALILGVFFLFFYSISIIKYFFIKKAMLYEKISDTKYISTLKYKEKASKK